MWCIFRELGSIDDDTCILIPRAHNPSGLWQGSRALAEPNFLSMRRVIVSYSQPISFARFDGKSVNPGLLVLDKARALDPCHRPEGSWALETRMMALDDCSSKGASSTSGGVIRRLGDQRRGNDRREAQV